MEKQSTMIWGGCWAGLFAAFWALVFNGTLIVYVLNIPHHWPIILLVLLGVLVETLLLGLFGMLTTIYLAFAAIDTIFRDKKQPKKDDFRPCYGSYALAFSQAYGSHHISTLKVSANFAK